MRVSKKLECKFVEKVLFTAFNRIDSSFENVTFSLIDPDEDQYDGLYLF